MHFLLITENEFIHEMKCNRMTSFMEFMISNRLVSMSTFRYSYSLMRVLVKACFKSSVMHVLAFW